MALARAMPLLLYLHCARGEGVHARRLCHHRPAHPTDVVDFATRGLDLPSGFIKPEKADVRVEVVRCKAVISDLHSKEVKFRAVDPPEHDNYACFWKPPDPHPDGRAVDTRPIHMHAHAPPLTLKP